MTKWAVHTLYTQTAHRVHTAALFAILLATPAVAQIEDTFAVFEARCLTPMVEIRESDVSGLDRIPHRAAWESWVSDNRNWELRRALPTAVIQYCAVHGAFGAEVDDWAEAAVASGDWVRIDREPETLQSTFIREPLIEVEVDRDAMPMSVTVIETNLES